MGEDLAAVQEVVLEEMPPLVEDLVEVSTLEIKASPHPEVSLHNLTRSTLLGFLLMLRVNHIARLRDVDL